MNMFSKRLVLIASFCLSAALCHADTVVTSSLPSVVTAVTAEKSAEALKSQAPALVVSVAPQSFRAKAMDKLRGLWGFCKRNPDTLLFTILTALVTPIWMARGHFPWMALVCLGYVCRDLQKELNIRAKQKKQAA